MLRICPLQFQTIPRIQGKKTARKRGQKNTRRGGSQKESCREESCEGSCRGVLFKHVKSDSSQNSLWQYCSISTKPRSKWCPSWEPWKWRRGRWSGGRWLCEKWKMDRKFLKTPNLPASFRALPSRHTTLSSRPSENRRNRRCSPTQDQYLLLLRWRRSSEIPDVPFPQIISRRSRPLILGRPLRLHPLLQWLSLWYQQNPPQTSFL